MNVYYDPEKFGLRTVGEVEMSDACYQFDTFVVWQDIGTGDFLWASDSGCSCPSPFEDTGVDDLTRGTAHQAAEAIQQALAERGTYGEKYGKDEAVELISRLMTAPAK